MQELGDPVAVATSCTIEQATAIVRCVKCGTRARLNLLAEQTSLCPGCDALYSSALLICEPHDVEAIADLMDTIEGAEDEENEQEQRDIDINEIPETKPAENQDANQDRNRE